MVASRLFSILIVLAVLLGCNADVQNEVGSNKDLPTWAQCQASNSEHNPCQVSMYSLVTVPGLYDGMYVDFVGYFPSKGARVLFVNRDAADSSDYLSSLLMESTFDDAAGYYKVSAEFTHDVHDSGLASGVYRQVGILKNVKLARVGSSISLLSEKCGDGSCEAYYINGVVPAVRDKSLEAPPE
jgi:hypothetical protein